ncbi:MAG: hypothetical protein ACMXYL_01150 [Candidatus Woesearchaeota archaeon]
MEKKYHGHAIMEVMGKPQEHVAETMRLLLKKAKDTKELEVIEHHMEEPQKVEDDSTLYSGFLEMEIKLLNMETIFGFILDYMPSSLEISDPDEINFDLSTFNGFLSDFIGRLHEYDKIVKEKIGENVQLQENIDLLIRNLIIISLKEKSLTAEEISSKVGIAAESLKPFLNKFADNKTIIETNDKYSLPVK